MTDNEIKKALEWCGNQIACTDGCPLDDLGGIDKCIHTLLLNALDLINRLEKENNDLFLELEGVMWSVDKWLDGDELKQDKVNRAITMREKTLQITEKQQAEIERLQKDNEYILMQHKFDRRPNGDCWNDVIEKAKTEAIKEFWKRFDKVLCENIGPSKRVYWEISSDGNNLVKEMTESVNYGSSKMEVSDAKI